jgi:glycosyltransferase involved in cell wall biosynthesis
MKKISVVITAHNEERNIEDCLQSVKGFADEIIVVDAASSDKTAYIEKKFTEKVFKRKNDPEKFDTQKNFGFEKATCDWVLSLDADERVAPSLADEIKEKIGKASTGGFWIPRKNIIFGKWIKSEMWWPDYQLRLFRRGKGRYMGSDVHEPLVVEGETQKLENFMVHENYTSVFQYIEKLNNYTSVEAKSLLKKGYDFNFLDTLSFPVDDFVKTFFLQKGYRDGLHGLVLSVLQAFYMEVVFAKLWEEKKFVEVSGESFLESVKEEAKRSGAKIRFWFASMLIDESKSPFKKTILRATRKFTSRNLK